MHWQPARIIKTSAESEPADSGNDHYAVVELSSKGSCAACRNGQGCGAGLLGSLLWRRVGTFSIPTMHRVYPGQQVWLSISESRLQQVAALVYVLPTVCLLLGIVLAYLVWPDNDIWQLSGAAIGLLIGVTIVMQSKSGDGQHITLSVDCPGAEGQHKTGVNRH